MIYVFLGMQGSGKGTQAKFLSKHLGLEHISLGEYFRKEIADKTQLGAVARKYLSKGHLVPDKKVFQVLEGIFARKENGFVFDGFPRTITQAEYLTDKYSVDKVIYLKLEDTVARERMMSRRICSDCKRDYNLLVNPPKIEGYCDECNGEIIRRADDTDELIQNRLDLFQSETEPLTDYYRKINKLAIVNAVGDINDVFEDIKNKIRN